MEASSGRGLEEQLLEAGNRLLQPPSSVDELIALLDDVENCLTRVVQSPPESMQNALSPSLKALIGSDLIRHSDIDVKVAVAACISEITRISAPDAPYDDDQMKEVFQLIVSSFENLEDKSSRSYNKRISILETVAKVRSCVVMLDLECDALIIEMFQLFLKSIRNYHPETVFTSMETIMMLVLEESEDISVELLTPVLACLKKDSEGFVPSARKLAEKVFEKCASKLKPYLIQAVKALGIFLDDYNEVVASICLEKSELVEQDDDDISVENQVNEENAAEVSSPEEVNATDDGPLKAVVSNGVTESVEGVSMMDSGSLKKPNNRPQNESDDGLDTGKGPEPVTETEKASKSHNKDVLGENENESVPQESPNHPTLSKSVLSETRLRKGGRPKKRGISAEEAKSSADVSKKTSEGSDSEVKPQRRSEKKGTDGGAEGKTHSLAETQKESTLGSSQAKASKLSGKKVEPSNKSEGGSSKKDQPNKKRRGGRKAALDKELKSTAEDDEKEMMMSPKPATKSTKGEPAIEGSSKGKSKRKRNSGREEVPDVEYGENLVGSKIKVLWPDDDEYYNGVIDSFDPIMKKYRVLYTDGDEETLDLSQEKWNFIEDDSLLEEGREADHLSPDAPSEMHRKKKAKTNPDLVVKQSGKDSSAKRGGATSSSKSRVASAKGSRKSKSDGKLDNDTVKPIDKSEDMDSVKSKTHTPRSGNKSLDDTPKSTSKLASKSKDADKTSNKLKPETPETKSKGKEAKSHSKLNANGSGKMKSSSSKVKENDDSKEKSPVLEKASSNVKGKSSETTKGRNIEVKSGKKRRR